MRPSTIPQTRTVEITTWIGDRALHICDLLFTIVLVILVAVVLVRQGDNTDTLESLVDSLDANTTTVAKQVLLQKRQNLVTHLSERLEVHGI